MDDSSPQTSPNHRTGERRTLVLLALGAAAGLLMASVGLLEPGGELGAAIPDDAVAIVNGEVIRRDDYLRLLAGFESDTRNALDDADRRHVLDRMIDEELLVQRGLELGLAQMDRRVRADLTSALIASVVSTAEEREPTETELRDFYARERDFFTRPGRLRARQIYFRTSGAGGVEAAQVRAEVARAEIVQHGRPFVAVASELGDEMISPLPDTLLPAIKLREYIGPSALAAVERLQVGELSQPVRSGVGLHLLELVDRTPAISPPYDEIATQVRVEWRRRTGDRALRAYLDQLREEGDVIVQLADPT
ncbi:MAG: peptidyl-prolyl cis-trans isomerase [Deltaproteobacteria bacterium]|nr:peptidyl-prolyl cis-trans isomerase [Deltaproteobacteria bacterium]